MDMNLLYAILIALVPVIIAIVMSKVYNIIHGFISFVVTGHLLGFCLTVFGANLPAELLILTTETCLLYTKIDNLIVGLLVEAGLGVLGDFAVYVVLAIFIVVFVVSQIISSVLRKKRVEKINSLKRQVKRY